MAYRAVLGLLVLATPVQSQLSQAWPNHALQRSPLCETIHNELLCARAIEAVQLPLVKGGQQTRGHTLGSSRHARILCSSARCWNCPGMTRAGLWMPLAPTLQSDHRTEAWLTTADFQG